MVFLLTVTAAASGQEAPTPPTVADLVARLQTKEKATKSVAVKIRTRSALPDGGQIETSGTLRVLDGTHFHVTSRIRLGDGMEGENEVVRTPEGTWMRDLDPIQGEVFTVMSPELIKTVEAASKALGEEGMPGGIPSQTEGPLGSALLTAMDRRFELTVDKKLVKDGIDHWVVRGTVRAGQTADLAGLPAPDTVEVVVSERPMAVVRVAQFEQGKEILVIEVDDVQIDPPMTAQSFRIDSRGKRFVDAMDHPPIAAQINALLEEAKRANAEPKKGTDRGK